MTPNTYLGPHKLDLGFQKLDLGTQNIAGLCLGVWVTVCLGVWVSGVAGWLRGIQEGSGVRMLPQGAQDGSRSADPSLSAPLRADS